VDFTFYLMPQRHASVSDIAAIFINSARDNPS